VLLGIVVALVAAVLALGLGIHIYAASYSHATATARKALATSSVVRVKRLDSGDVLFVPQDAGRVSAALVFYPGGKVEATAYAPLLRSLAERGIACALTRMPENLAVLAPNAADRSRGELEDALRAEGRDPQDVPWMMGGHSLGGAMAASYAGDHASEYRGLALLAAYSSGDISKSGLRVLLVLGTRDGVLNRDKYKSCLANLPQDYREVEIKGGNHAGFGSYGRQDGDRKATVSGGEQVGVTVQAIANLAETL
jgi:predicted esterase